MISISEIQKELSLKAEQISVSGKRIVATVASKEWLGFANQIAAMSVPPFRLLCIAAVRVQENLRVIVELESDDCNQHISLQTTLAKNLKLPSVAGFWPSADWHEKEITKYFNIEFENSV